MLLLTFPASELIESSAAMHMVWLERGGGDDRRSRRRRGEEGQVRKVVVVVYLECLPRSAGADTWGESCGYVWLLTVKRERQRK